MKKLILFTCLLYTAFLTANAQKLKVANTNDFVMECMKLNGEIPNKQMAVWYPYNFWEIIGQQMKVSPEFVENIVAEMKEYMMFAVVDYTIKSGNITFKSDDEIRKTIQLVDSSNNVLLPLSENEISASAQKLIQSLEPVIAQMLGQFGEGMKIYLFKIKTVNGIPIIDVTNKNHFMLKWNKTVLNWTLPFSSAVAPKYCPVDKEQMKGTWKFCPIHGVELN